MKTISRSGLTILTMALIVVPVSARQGSGGTDKLRTTLSNTGLDPDATGRVRLRWSDSHQRLRIDVKNLDPGMYDLLVDGVVQDAIRVVPDDDGTGTRGRLRRGSRGEGLVVDPRGAELSIARGGEVYLTGVLPTSREDGSRRLRLELDLDNVGSRQPSARADAEFRAEDGRERFRVTLRDALPGLYELVVGSTSQGSFEVHGDHEGTIKFDTVPHSAADDWRLLTFDPLGQELEVLFDGAVVFQGTMPARG